MLSSFFLLHTVLMCACVCVCVSIYASMSVMNLPFIASQLIQQSYPSMFYLIYIISWQNYTNQDTLFHLYFLNEYYNRIMEFFSKWYIEKLKLGRFYTLHIIFFLSYKIDCLLKDIYSQVYHIIINIYEWILNKEP